MDIDQVETFLAIAQLGGFTRAALRLRRTQPAISRRLNLLEQELGAPMFDRVRGDARLTEAGRAFLPHAEAALAALKDGREAVGALRSGLCGEVALALVGTLADTHIVAALRRFGRRARGAILKVRTASSAEVTELVRRGEATLGLRYFAATSAELVQIPAGEEKMVVIAEAGHRLAGRRLRDGGALAGERWLAFPPRRRDGLIGDDALPRQLIRAGLNDAEIVPIDSLTAQKRLVQAGFGLALVPASSVRDELRRGLLVALDAAPMRTSIPITAIHRRNGFLSPAAKLLLDLLTRPPARRG